MGWGQIPIDSDGDTQWGDPDPPLPPKNWPPPNQTALDLGQQSPIGNTTPAGSQGSTVVTSTGPAQVAGKQVSAEIIILILLGLFIWGGKSK